MYFVFSRRMKEGEDPYLRSQTNEVTALSIFSLEYIKLET